MNRIIQPGDYTFDASAQTVEFANYNPVILENIKLIYNLVDGVPIYMFSNPSLLGTVATDTLTLAFDTTSMSDTDDLLIVYDDPAFIQPISAASLPLPTGAASAANQATIIGHIDTLETLVGALGALLTTIDADTSSIAGEDFATETTLAALNVIAGDIKTAVQLIDNAISGAGFNITQISGTNVSVNSGNKDAGTQRVAIATDDINLAAINTAIAAVKTAVELIDNAISGAGFNITQVAGTNMSVNSGNKDAGTQRVALATDDINLAAINTNIAAIKTAVELIDNAISGAGFNITQVGGTAIDTNSGNKSAGTQRMVIATDQPNLTTPLNVKQSPQTSGGLDIFRSIDLDETEEAVKATAGQLFGWYIFNKAATTIYVKLYNDTVANVTVGSTTPVMTIPIPAGSGANVLFETGIAFSAAITAAATTGVADADTGAPAANDIIANFFYK